MTEINQVNPNTNYIDRFDLSKEMTPNYDNVTQTPFGHPIDLLRAGGNLTYLQFIDLLSVLWARNNAEVIIAPFGNREKYDPEKGYIIYNLESKKPSENNLKPRFREDVVRTDAGDFQGTIFSQTFDHLIEFTAVHKHPRIAEEILESFEDFMMFVQPNLKYAGVEDFYYTRRVTDRDQTRFGTDLAFRSVMYLARLQKLLIVRPEVLESVRIDVRVFKEKGQPEANEVMFLEIPPPE